MNNSLFIKYQIREWRMLFLIAFFAPLTLFLSVILYYAFIVYNSPLLSLAPVFAISYSIVGIIFPFFIYNFAFSKRLSDSFYPVPGSPLSIIRRRILIASIYLFLSETLSYIISLAFAFLVGRKFIYGSVLHLLYPMFMGMILSFCNFCLSLLATSRANTLANGILINILFQLFLSFIIYALKSYGYAISFRSLYFSIEETDFLLGISNFGYYLSNYRNPTSFIFNPHGIIYISLSLASLLLCLFYYQKSSSCAGLPGPKSRIDEIFLHVAYAVFASSIRGLLTLGFVYFRLMIYLIYEVVYLGILFFYYHSLHLKKKQWIPFGVVSFLTLLASFAF